MSGNLLLYSSLVRIIVHNSLKFNDVLFGIMSGQDFFWRIFIFGGENCLANYLGRSLAMTCFFSWS
ncbi:hypothetical protein DSUL_20077 [Desulfovibrionales bacterium]